MIIAGNLVISRINVLAIDTTDLEDLRVVLTTLSHGDVEVNGIQAIEAVMLLKPSALENRRLRWVKRAWMVHNIVGHPLMQFLAFFRFYRTAMAVHDLTVPKPRGIKDRRGS